MKATRLLRVALNVRDLGAAVAFYAGSLGFRPDGPTIPAPHGPGRSQMLRRAGQGLELTAYDLPGAPYPADTRTDDLWFQHCALVTDDIAAAHARLAGVAAFSRGGPVTLPGGIVAWKFRDPDGHPLELIQFPQPDPATAGGIDHSAIAVADAERSIAFYATLGVGVASRQVNTGPAQDRLDGLDGVIVDVVALAPDVAAPHVELLGYRRPLGRSAPAIGDTDIAASTLVFAADVDTPTQLRDPDGHRIVLLPG